MKKKILILGAVLALVAALAVPLAALAQTGTTPVTGTVGTFVSLTPPAPIAVWQPSGTGQLILGPPGSANTGNSTVANGGAGYVNWINAPTGCQVTVESNEAGGFMQSPPYPAPPPVPPPAATLLTNSLLVTTANITAPLVNNVPVTLTPVVCLNIAQPASPPPPGSPIELIVSQTLHPFDPPGGYGIILTYTASTY